MSLVYNHNNFNCPEGEFKKNQDFMDPYYTPNLQQQNQLFSTDFSDDLIAGDNDDYRSFRSPSPEMDSFFANVMKDEETEQNGFVNGSEIGCRNLGLQSSGNSGCMMNSSFSVMNNAGFENSVQVGVGNDNHNNVSGLARQRSSPAGFLSDLMMENEFSATRDFHDFRNTNNVNLGSSSSKKGVNSHMNLQYGMSGSHSSVAQSQDQIGSGSSNDSWNKSSFNFSGATEGTNITFSGSETQNGSSNSKLVHHLSLPTTFSEKDKVEKFLHFQGTSVPCKIRAKRGFATHPRSIAERVRRNRISQRMRKLQDLFPEMDKQTNTADMLDMAVAHIKELQQQVKALTDTRAKCRCPGK